MGVKPMLVTSVFAMLRCVKDCSSAIPSMYCVGMNRYQLAAGHGGSCTSSVKKELKEISRWVRLTKAPRNDQSFTPAVNVIRRVCNERDNPESSLVSSLTWVLEMSKQRSGFTGIIGTTVPLLSFPLLPRFRRMLCHLTQIVSLRTATDGVPSNSHLKPWSVKSVPLMPMSHKRLRRTISRQHMLVILVPLAWKVHNALQSRNGCMPSGVQDDVSSLEKKVKWIRSLTGVANFLTSINV